MCRLFAYSGAPVWLDSLLIEPEASLVSQSMSAREAKTVVNGDGCGIGWYGDREVPGVFRDTRPAWADANLASLCRQIRSGLFMAHVRSATSGEVARANCHPFVLDRHLFMHNGQIGGYDAVRRRVEGLIPDAVYHGRRGTCDSEAIFLIAAGHGIAEDPLQALATALRLCLGEMRQAGNAAALRFSAALTDGKRLFGIRWSSDAHPPSLYWRRVPGGVAISSEPFSLDAEPWTAVAPGTALSIDGDAVAISDFAPI